MKSIAAAITWEILHKGRWNLIAGFLCANLIPALLFTAFRRTGVDFQDPSLITIHSTLILTNMCICATAIFSVQGPPSRLYTYPIPTSTLVACHLIPTMVFVWIEMLLSTLFLNMAFDLRWPVWSSAAFAATSIGLVQATLWFTEKTAWLPWALSLVAGVIGVWYHYRFSHRLFEPTQIWITAAPVEAALFFVTLVVTSLVGMTAMARNRCGEQLRGVGFTAWVSRLLDVAPGERPAFRTAEEAQDWFEWRLKGWAMPVTVIAGLLIGMSIWVVSVRDPKELVSGFIAGGGLLSAAGMVWAIIIGNVGPLDSNFEMGHFLATRPMTSKDLARRILKLIAQSVFLAWSIWAVAFLIVAVVLFATGFAPEPFFPVGVGWWIFPIALIASWTVVSVLASFGLTGRSTLCAQLFLTTLGMCFGGICIIQFVLPEDARKWFVGGIMVFFGTIFILGTISLFIAALRRKLVESFYALASFCVCAALSAIVVSTWIRYPAIHITSCILLVGLASLVVAPLAAAPLALSWNRTR